MALGSLSRRPYGARSPLCLLGFAALALSTLPTCTRAPSTEFVLEDRPVEARSLRGFEGPRMRRAGTFAGSDPETAQFGLDFADSQRFTVGSGVSGSLLPPGAARDARPTALTGLVTSSRGNVVSVSLQNRSASAQLVVTLDLVLQQFSGWWASEGGVGSFMGWLDTDLEPPHHREFPAVISGIEPSVARPGEVVKIRGEGFGTEKGRTRLVLAGQPVVAFPGIVSWSDTEITASIPSWANGLYLVSVPLHGIPSIPIQLDVRTCTSEPFTKLFGGSGVEQGFAVRRTADCGFILAGRTNSFANGEGSGEPHSGGGDFDAFVIRTDSAGEELWSGQYGGGGHQEAHDVIETRTGNILLVGSTEGTILASGERHRDVWVVMLDAQGTMIWDKTYGGAETNEEAFSVTARHGHGAYGQGYVLAGRTDGGEQGGLDGLIMRLDSEGEIVWSTTTGGDGDDELRAVQLAQHYRVVAVGRTNSPSLGAQGYDAYAVGLESGGELSWQRRYGGNADDELHAIAPAWGGNYFATGATQVQPPEITGGDMLVLEIDEAGNELRFRELVGRTTDGARSVLQTPDRGLVLAGFTDSYEYSPEGMDALALKLDCDLRPGDSETFAPAKARRDRALAADGYALAGDAQVSETDLQALLAVGQPFADSLPTIHSFTINGQSYVELDLGDPLTLEWSVDDATEIELYKLALGEQELLHSEQGGPLFNGDYIRKFDANCADGCADVVYRLVASSACGAAEVQVTAGIASPICGELSDQEIRRIEIESMVVQRFEQPMGTVGDTQLWFWNGDEDWGALGGAHPNPAADGPTRNVCFSEQGFPYAVADEGIMGFGDSGQVDDSAPGLLFYRGDGVVAAFAYGGILHPGALGTPPQGAPVDDSEWYGHWGGWHTGDGAMTLWANWPTPVPLDPHPRGPDPLCPTLGDWDDVSSYRSHGCGADPPPFIWHPAFWDVHLYRDFDDCGPPRPAKLTGEVDLPNPCEGIGLAPCETGQSLISASRVATFFDVVNGEIVVRYCDE